MCISRLLFFASDLLLTVFYIYFRLEMMLDKRQIQAILLFEFRMGSKIAETTYNVSNAFGKGTANECTVQGWFKKFYKGDGSLEVEECSGRPQKLTMTIVSHQWSWSSYNYMRRCQRIQHQPFCGCSAFKANFVQSLSSTLYSTMDCSIPGFPVLLKLPESAQTHVHWVNDATQPSHPLLSPSPPALNLSQHQGLFQCQFFVLDGQSFRASVSTSVLPMNIQGWFPLGLTGLSIVQGALKSLLHHHSLKASILQHSAFFMVQIPHEYMTTGKIVLERWKSRVKKLAWNLTSKKLKSWYLVPSLHGK